MILRWDKICEQQRETLEIRKRLADTLRKRRLVMADPDNTFDAIVAARLDLEIEILQWVCGVNS